MESHFRHGGVRYFFKYPSFRYTLYLRILQDQKFKIVHKMINVFRFRLSRKYGIEIQPKVQIGSGFRMIHPYNITINPNVVIGKNFNIFKGATIGFACGKKNGVPVIGDNVQVGINATVIGKITIGDDVLIAPNAFVNIDVPSNSVVIGNPCMVFHKEDATKEYVFFRV